MAAFPPQRIYKPTSLSTIEAQTWLTTYLMNTENTAYLQPDALLTPSGPTTALGMSSVTIYNLKRLQSGLNGKYNVSALASDREENGLLDQHFKPAVVNVQDTSNVEQDWQDKSEFEREQSVEMGEIGDSDPSHGMAGTDSRAELASHGREVPIDKKARKQAKKEKKKQLRADKQKARDQD